MPLLDICATLDAAKMPYLLTAELSGSGLEYQSLFQGEAQEDLGEHVPYIVRLEEGNDFTRKLFTDLEPPLGLWKKELGIFIRSRASLPELRKHFRKFTRLQDENGKWYYFRFWEGVSLSYYFENVSNDEISLNRFFHAHEFKVQFVFYSNNQATAKLMTSTTQTPIERTNSTLIFSKQDLLIFRQRRLETSLDKICRYLELKNEEFASQHDEKKKNLTKILVEQAGAFGIKIEQAVGDFAEASLLLGEPLNQDTILKDILESDIHPLDKGKQVLLEVRKRLGN